jgi:hypothetical protein
MANIYGALGIQEYQADQVFLQTIGYELVYTTTLQYLAMSNQDMNMAMSLFVDATVETHSTRYKLPGGGRLQRRGNTTSTGAAKATGSWDVAFPIEDFGRQVAENDVAFAYMTAAEYQRHLDSVLIANANTVRFEILRALFNNTARTFIDDTLNTPTLTIQPLANGDAVLYPPVIGSESEATDNHYLAQAAAIASATDPFPTMVAELEEHFGVVTGGSDIVVLANPAQRSLIQNLADFVPVATRAIDYGDDVSLARPSAIPPGMSAKLLGTHGDAGCDIAEWAWIPSGYLIAVHRGAARPLMRRVDPAATGLGRDLQLVTRKADWPNSSAHWRHRFGFGCGNRLNGVVMFTAAGDTTYDIPSIYA